MKILLSPDKNEFIRNVHLFYEHPVTNKMSFQIGLQYNPESISKKNKFVTSIAP